MTELFSKGGWLMPSLLALLCWGIWGFLAKLVAGNVTWQTQMIFSALGTLLVVSFAKPTVPAFDGYHMIGIASGLLAGLASLFFYRAIARGEASVVIPLTSLYVALATVLGFVVLSEPVTVKKVLGLILAVVAMFLLAGG